MSARYMSVVSTDVESAAETWNALYPGAVMGRYERNNYLFRFRSATIDDLVVLEYELTSPVVIESDMSELFLVSLMSGDGRRMESGRDSYDVDRPIVLPRARTRFQWASAKNLAVSFDRAEAERMARGIMADDHLVLRSPGGPPLTPELGAFWTHTLQHVRSIVYGIPELDSRIIETNLRRTMLVATLAAFPSSVSLADATEGQAREAPRNVRIATQYAEDNAHRPITVEDIAEAAHLSVRGLQYAFRHELDTTPTEYLRRVRLDGAHRDLLAADASNGVTVAKIAQHWGFAHLSRFARQYRETYGELPRATLER